MRILMLALTLLVAATAFAQNGEYKSLTDEQATEAKAAWEQLQSAQAHWREVLNRSDKLWNHRVEDSPSAIYTEPGTSGQMVCSGNTCGEVGYLTPRCDEKGCSNWEFSKDFRLMLPRQLSSGVIRTSAWPCSGILTLSGTQSPITFSDPPLHYVDSSDLKLSR